MISTLRRTSSVGQLGKTLVVLPSANRYSMTICFSLDIPELRAAPAGTRPPRRVRSGDQMREILSRNLFLAAAPRRKAKRKEHGAKSKDRDFFLHVFFSVSIHLPRHLTLAPSHLITLFARSSTRTGIVRPICFAAFRLMTNSNFVACCTGKSAGLAPFKILST